MLYIRKMLIPWNKGIKTGIKPRNSFPVGHKPWNKGKIGVQVSPRRGVVIQSDEREEMSQRMMGEKHWNWKGGSPLREYNRIHHRLRRTHGKALHCVNINCPKTSTRFQYALKQGHTYSIEKEDYLELCAKCHGSYDNSKPIYQIKISLFAQ